MKELLAHFSDSPSLVRAINDLRQRGYRSLDAAIPYPIKEVERALDLSRTPFTWLMGFVAVGAGIFAALVMWWTNAHAYPLDVGGRPVFSFWSDIPIIFETMILGAGVTGFFAFFFASGLPRLHHRWFDAESVDDGFWLAIDTADPKFEATIERVLLEHGALTTQTVGEDRP